MGIVVIAGLPLTSVLVTVVTLTELEDVLGDSEFGVVLQLEPRGPVWEPVVEVASVVPVSELPVEALAEVPALPGTVDEVPLPAGMVVVELDQPPLMLFEPVANVDDAEPVALSEGTGKVSEIVKVIVLDVGQVEIDDVVFILEAPLEEEAIHPPEEELDKLAIVPLPFVAEEEIEIVGSVMVGSVPEGVINDSELPEAEVCVVSGVVGVVPQAGVVVLIDMAVMIVIEPLTSTVELLLSGGSVNPG
ncbi:hypothetical protein NUW58_g9959 [Xylaria curta]|uniref:Uncharacterized protein n=1 Tax=Xylaria curta TaxID=42375 RepID=A0ACC1MSS6_9PEZI|nr:hypothetical protein NUW58_g9959 [Xylaria curta]